MFLNAKINLITYFSHFLSIFIEKLFRIQRTTSVSSSATTIMAEVTSNSASAQCSPLRKKARMEDTADAFKPVGSLTFRIDNFREFTERPPGFGSMRHCDAKVSVRGLTFGLAVFPVRPNVLHHMGVILKCENTSGCDVKGDGSWSCLALVTLRIKSLLGSGKEEMHECKYTHKFFSSKEKSSLKWELEYPWHFDYLLNPRRHLYNEKDDTLELIVEISVDTPAGIMELPKTDIIQVNGEPVNVNKNQLAMHSPYFHSLFYNAQFDEGKSGQYKVEIEEPATVEHFKRMLATMCPMNKPLDDKCIEGVLHLANQFLVADVEGKCLEFLREKSWKPALFKYRVADKYGYTALKKNVLDNLNAWNFKKKMFETNIAEYVQLGPDAAKTFMARYNKLFLPESDEEE